METQPELTLAQEWVKELQTQLEGALRNETDAREMLETQAKRIQALHNKQEELRQRIEYAKLRVLKEQEEARALDLQVFGETVKNEM